MKKVVFALGILLFLVFFALNNNYKENKKNEILNPTVIPADAQVLSVTDSKEQTFLFVPYWGQTQERIPDSYGNKLIYFGIAPNKNGIDTNEDGYFGLGRFKAIAEGRETFLAVRMVDPEMSFPILKDKQAQQKIITQTIDIAKEYGFNGVVLDLEISSLPFASVTDQMNNFVKEFSGAAKAQNLTFSITFFGDTFYRLRPYDVTVLRQYIDMAFVMAYDFSKAKGDPGPNFPLLDKEKYGYDFTLMVEDFINLIPKEKIVVVFGMFGYDWAVDAQGFSQKQAEARTLTVAKKQFIDQCLFRNCSVKRDELSAETTVSYVDKDGNNHIVWFEDEESVAKKREFLKEKGINSVGFWAYSYF